MAGLAVQALTIGGFSVALGAFSLTAAVLVVLLFAVATIVALAQERALGRLQDAAPAVKRWGGRLLLLVGGWFIVLALLAGPFRGLFPV